MILLVLAACADGKGSPEDNAGKVATVASTIASCSQYEDLPEALGVCLSERVVSLDDLDDVEALCPRAGTWEPDCRQAWVDEQQRLRRGRTPDELLRACGPNADCAFQILDAFPAADVLEQMARCEQHAGPYAEDCVGHATQRWTWTRPTPEQGVAVLAAAGRHARQVATFVGMSQACGGTLVCPEGTDPVAHHCRQAAETFRTAPDRCPVR